VAAAAIGLASADAWSTVGHVCLMDTSGHLLALARPTPTAAEGRVRLQPDVVVMPET
jgi:hypothetical protein